VASPCPPLAHSTAKLLASLYTEAAKHLSAKKKSIMSILKHQIIQEKLLQQSLDNSFTLIFHLNPISTKELTGLKKSLFKKNIRNSHQVLSLRFFHKWKLPEKKTISSFLINDNNHEGVQPSWKHLGGSSCVFFCSTIKELQDILLTIKSLPQASQSYLNIGMILNKKSNINGISDNTFLSSYDMEVFLKTNTSIYSKFLVLLNKNSIFYQIDIKLVLNTYFMEMNQFNLVQILSLYAKKLKTNTLPY
jgi:hypothetical protein